MPFSLPLAALALTLLGGLALILGPVLAYARAYVERLEAAFAATGAAADTGAAEAAGSVAHQASSGPTPPQPTAPAIRRRWLLHPVAQLLLALLLGGSTALWAWHYGQVHDGVVAVPTIMLLGTAGSIDAICHRLPNRILGGAAAWLGLGLMAQIVVVLLRSGSLTTASLVPLRAGLVALALGGAVFLMAWLRAGLGAGDVKLCAVTGLWLGLLGWSAALTGFVIGFFLAGLLALVLLATGQAKLKTRVALGPALILGAWLAWLLQMAAGAAS